MIHPSPTAMTRRDYSWFRMDAARNLMVINSVLMFDGVLDFEGLRATIEHRLPNYPRFTQIVSKRWGAPCWVTDERFDIRRHVELTVLDGHFTDTELQQHFTGQALDALPHDRPLWHMQVVQHQGNGYAIVFRLHHCITDGEGLVHVLKHLTDDSSDHGFAPALEGHPRHCRASVNPLCKKAHRVLFWSKITAQLARLTFLRPDLHTQLKRPLTKEKSLLILPPLDLAQVRSVAKRMNATINDVWVAAVSNALRRYLQEQGEDVDKRAVRGAVTFNLRNKGDAFLLGNHFGLVAVNLASTEPDPCEQLRQTSRHMRAIKASHQPHATMFFLTLTGFLPRVLQSLLLKIFTSKGSVVLTNVEGPPQPRYLAGARLSRVACWVPQAGTMGVGFALMSYAGQIQVSLFADHNQVSDAPRLMALVGEAFSELERVTRNLPAAEQAATTPADALPGVGAAMG
ncbi:WS/DGAT domain-containing protein [Roseateles koreensis]|uniref:diacylglycerol O-acyltransferase n=1 Tax=Roseateles koreensis TaxID=2987526 RepID=A0ABT5KPV2_9BURK|nr:WS/DGAT domain-containing protein [Roseateles koreensis]MDC8784946.1 WS/DGAT domain-containing protein [Roseateles koreensis]